MTKHTPGPWSLDWEHSRQDVDLCSASGMVSGRPAWFIALDGLLDRTDAEHVEEFEANAKLIAASPRMGDFILRVRDHLICGDPDEQKALIAEAEEILIEAGLDEPLPEEEGPSISYPTSGFRGMDR